MVMIDIPANIFVFSIMAVPFFMFLGFWKFSNWMVNFIKVRQGFMEYMYILKNHQIKTKMFKPKSNEVKIGENRYPFSTSPEYLAFKGNKKVIFFSRIGNALKQLRYFEVEDKKAMKESPNEDIFNDMLLQAEATGKLFGIKKDKLEKILAIVAAVGVVVLLLFAFVQTESIKSLDTRLNQTIENMPDAEQIADNVAQRIRPDPLANATRL